MALIKPGQLRSGSYSISGSFSGSFYGDGSGLSNLPVPIVNTSSLVTTSSFNAFTSSINSFTASYNTGSFTGTFTGTSSYATVANSVNDLNQNVFISGSLTVLQGATIYGSSSFTYITASQLDVSASFISVNVFEPAQRFGGLKIYDSGSSTATASFAWDSLHNHFVYQNASGSTYNGGMFLSGPRNTGSLGDEPNLTRWYIARSDGGDHLNDTQIYSSGSIHIVTGSLTVTAGITGSLSGSALTATSASYALTASYVAGASSFPYTGSALITGSLGVTGSLIATQIGAGAAPSGSVRLDVRAQGSASSDVAFRVRNSADTATAFEIRGDRAAVFNGSAGTAFTPIFAVYRNGTATLYIDEYATKIDGSLYVNTILGHSNNPIYFSNQGGLGGYIHMQASSGILRLGTTLSGTSATNTFVIASGTAPTTSPTDVFQQYSADRNGVAGKASPHFRTEDGTVVWLGDESRLFNVTASRTIISSSQNTISGSSLTVYGSGSTQPVFTVQGSQGELFSVTDSLSGSLFSVNDISGLPILEVFSDNTTLIGNYLDPMLITTAKVTQTNSGSFVLYSLPTASYDTAFFEYSVKSGSNARAGTIMAIQSGASVNFTEVTSSQFGSTSAISFTVIVTGSNMALTGSSTTGSWTIKTIVRGL